MGILKKVGNATLGIGKGIGKAILVGSDKATKKIGKAAWSVAKAGVKGADVIVKDAWKARNDTGPNNVIGVALHDAKTLISNMGSWERGTVQFDRATGKVKHKDGRVKLTTFGKSAFYVPAAAFGALGAADAYMNNRVGTIDGEVVTASPSLKQGNSPSYANNGGATGDLVFAMHANRRG